MRWCTFSSNWGKTLKWCTVSSRWGGQSCGVREAISGEAITWLRSAVRGENEEVYGQE